MYSVYVELRNIQKDISQERCKTVYQFLDTTNKTIEILEMPYLS